MSQPAPSHRPAHAGRSPDRSASEMHWSEPARTLFTTKLSNISGPSRAGVPPRQNVRPDISLVGTFYCHSQHLVIIICKDCRKRARAAPGPGCRPVLPHTSPPRQRGKNVLHRRNVPFPRSRVGLVICAGHPFAGVPTSAGPIPPKRAEQERSSGPRSVHLAPSVFDAYDEPSAIHNAAKDSRPSRVKLL